MTGPSGSASPLASITPQTRVGPLLDRHPELEAVLVALSPAYAALRNPVLRRTVARVATLEQVARIGGLPPSRLVQTLREAAGLDGEVPVSESSAGAAAVALSPATSPGPDTAAAPAWFDRERIVSTLDAGPLIDSGEHPLAKVMADLATLQRGDIYELMAPFVPAPLIDRAMQKGFACWTRRDAEGIFHSFFSPET